MWNFFSQNSAFEMRKVADFVAAVVEDQRAPFAVLALARIGVLVERGSIEIRKPVRVFREVRGHPVHDHADAVLMALVDEVHEVVRRAEARGGREVADDLIAPGAGERVFHDGQQLDMRVAHRFTYSTSESASVAVRDRLVLRTAQPGFEMHFVDGDGRFQRLLQGALLHPLRRRPSRSGRGRPPRKRISAAPRSRMHTGPPSAADSRAKRERTLYL